jgi:AmpD protein
MGPIHIGIPVRWWPSPHYTPGRKCAVDLLIIHAISLPPRIYGSGHVIDFFTGKLNADLHPYYAEIKDMRVSAHFFIERLGGLHQFVDTEDTAWHAGESEFDGRTHCNDFSVGIELEGHPDHAFTPQQYATLKPLTQALLERYPLITPERIVGHSHISGGRKVDPGPFFDWKCLLEDAKRTRRGGV